MNCGKISRRGAGSWALVLLALALPAEAAAQPGTNPQPGPLPVTNAHLKRGDELSDQKNWGAAAREYNEALHLEPESVDARVGLGRALGEMGDLGRALPLFREALAQQPDSAEAHNVWSEAHSCAAAPSAAAGRGRCRHGVVDTRKVTVRRVRSRKR